jgi:hypothetical protein
MIRVLRVKIETYSVIVSNIRVRFAVLWRLRCP